MTRTAPRLLLVVLVLALVPTLAAADPGLPVGFASDRLNRWLLAGMLSVLAVGGLELLDVEAAT